MVLPVILSADSSQRACIAAALAGKSFVMDGPPGTGKSQTIANIIGVLLHAGKTVLFVSEKVAALDVVRDRLTDRGLGAYLLELHSAQATRKQVAEELGQALSTELVPPAVIGVAHTARARREQLNQYADAMNRKRDPLGVSLQRVLGRIALLNDLPDAPVPAITQAELTAGRFDAINSAARTLGGAWRPALQGDTFAWRGVVEQGLMAVLLNHAASALATLFGTITPNARLAEATGLTRPSHAAALAAILAHASDEPAVVPGHWLTAQRLAPIGDTMSKLDSCLTAITKAQDEASAAAGTAWDAVPSAEALPALLDLTGVFPPTPSVTGMRVADITALAGTLQRGAELLAYRAASLTAMAGTLGLESPATFARASDILSLARLTDVPLHPERSWMTPDGHRFASAAAETLRNAVTDLATTEIAAQVYYTPQALNEDVEGLITRAAAHHGLRKLSGDYRNDRRTIAAFTAAGVSADAAQRNLSLAVAWQNATRAFASAERTCGRALGSYYRGRETNFEAVAAALGVAETALRLVRGEDVSRVADYLNGDRSAPLAGMAEDISHDLRSWWSGGGAAAPELMGGTMTGAIDWLRAQHALLEAIATRTHMVELAVDRPLTVGTARSLVALRGAVDAAYDRLAALTEEFDGLLGELYAGPQTDMVAVRCAYEWVSRLRELVTGNSEIALSESQTKEVAAHRSTPFLSKAVETWQVARDSLVAAFDSSRHRALFADLDDYEEAHDLIKTLLQDTAGQAEWHAYHQARATLDASGLSRTAAFCVTQRVPAEQVPSIIERAVLQGWAEQVLSSDPALSAVRAVERDALVREYQKVDEMLISNAVADIIRACNRRRPRADIGEPAVIRREAEKKRKHMPVHTLLERTRNAALAVKPCFMMSPLAVSQFLPPEMRFDVVIFDEASQVLPGDAINCIYRGSALILAGDQKQLPPTSWMFGGTGADDGEDWSEDADDTADFESILDLAKGAGVFRELSLRWHRRSRHEALIAFSNHSFYRGEILTFPGAGGDGPDVGVEFFFVPDGVYRRGTSRDNPTEAVRVAERVIHHYATRPHKSLGVVAFSEAQAATIEAAVAAARTKRPDLDQYFRSDDRLHGFFVKNLESVQGDERDVMIFSIGYGPDENGKLTMNFGPLIKAGGWRRLNVAITRAHYRNEIVASIRAGDISGTATSEGTRYLRKYLDFAERGMAALALDIGPGGDAESPFEESVINVIRSWGYEVTPQVGTAGYRIDIGVRHPRQPGAFCIGIECDGYQYHSSRAARDRDRLREEVLRGLGWRLHRIWGTAWYRDRNGSEAALRAAIEKAAAAPVTGLLTETAATRVPKRPNVSTRPTTFDEIATWTKPYTIASVPRLMPWVQLGDLGSSYYEMIAGIRPVAEVEGPVHIEVLHSRLRAAWGIGRLSKDLRDNIDRAIVQAGVIRAGDFIMTPETTVTVRTPTRECQRTVGQIHDSELDLALLKVVEFAAGVSEDELTARVASIFGWERRGPDITARLHERILELLDSGSVRGPSNNLTAAKQPDRT